MYANWTGSNFGRTLLKIENDFSSTLSLVFENILANNPDNLRGCHNFVVTATFPLAESYSNNIKGISCSLTLKCSFNIRSFKGSTIGFESVL